MSLSAILSALARAETVGDILSLPFPIALKGFSMEPTLKAGLTEELRMLEKSEFDLLPDNSQNIFSAKGDEILRPDHFERQTIRPEFTNIVGNIMRIEHDFLTANSIEISDSYTLSAKASLFYGGHYWEGLTSSLKLVPPNARVYEWVSYTPGKRYVMNQNVKTILEVLGMQQVLDLPVHADSEGRKTVQEIFTNPILEMHRHFDTNTDNYNWVESLHAAALQVPEDCLVISSGLTFSCHNPIREDRIKLRAVAHDEDGYSYNPFEALTDLLDALLHKAP